MFLCFIADCEVQKATLRAEFIETMKQRFLNGEETEFDYRLKLSIKVFTRTVAILFKHFADVR